MQILFCFQALFVLWTWRQFHLWSSLKDLKCKVFSFILTCKCIRQAGDLTAVFLFGSFAHPDEENFSAFAFQYLIVAEVSKARKPLSWFSSVFV